jgi:hypothetical protein
MKNHLFCALAVLALSVAFAFSAEAAPQSYTYNGRDYYVVNGNDPAADTGAEVCASAGRTCVGYTGFTNDICKNFHPRASATESVNGSKAGFYCDGAPQKGLACETAKNNCQVCPACNVNADCSTQIGTQFREMYVECSGPSTISASSTPLSMRLSSWWGGIRSSLANRLAPFIQQLRTNLTALLVKKVKVVVTNPDGTTTSADVPSDSMVCEFYQTNKKLVSCGAVKAADTFCTQAMQSRFAKAALCQENGIIVCSNPCDPPEAQVKPKQCAFDNARPRGSQAAPLDFCNQTVTVNTGSAKGTKRAGELCQHGGECATGNCLGQPSDQGIKYFCSCDPFRLDYSCN